MISPLSGDARSGFYLKGSLTHQAVSELPPVLPGLDDVGKTVECSLEGVSNFDSTLLALMQQWYVGARLLNSEIRFSAIPAPLHDLIETYKLFHLLPDD